jgi:hypothetical protein
MEKPKAHNKPLFILLLIIVLGTGLFLSGKRTYDWVFVYYMSYDNDLSGYGQTILKDLSKGITSSKIAVVTQADFLDSKGMKRIALYQMFERPKRKETSLQSEDSADPAELKKYFEWVREKWKAENYCIIFLNHGGALNNMCRDENPFRDSKKNKKFDSGKWLPATEVGKITADFNRKVGGKVRLLFLQQCSRAAIQNLYNFIDTAEYIMASPIKVDAPNTYYTEMLKSVANDPNTTGISIAKTIMQEDEHYTIYTLIDNAELKKLPDKLDKVIDCFAQNPNLKQPQSCNPIFEFKGENFYDLKSYFQALSSANNNIAEKELGIFFDWCNNNLIIAKATKNAKAPTKPFDSGLSIYIPSNKSQLGLYDFLPLYKQTNLENLIQPTSE